MAEDGIWLMSVVLYWRQRLIAGRPIRSDTLWAEGYNYRPLDKQPDSTWPKAVAKQALFQDYLGWFEEEYLKPFAASKGYAEFPDQLPKPANELGFFSQINPMLMLVGASSQVRNYKVTRRQLYEGRWIDVKGWRSFVRLCEWDEHVSAFILQTGSMIPRRQPRTLSQDIEAVAGAVQVAIKRLATNREAMVIIQKPQGD